MEIIKTIFTFVKAASYFIIPGIIIILLILALTGALDSTSEKLEAAADQAIEEYSTQDIQTEEEAKKQNPIISFVGLVVLVGVAFITYKAMYAGTAIIGTHEGIMSAIGRRLAIPVIVGAIAAGIVMKILEFIGSILMILIVIAAIGAVSYFVYNKFVVKKENWNS